MGLCDMFGLKFGLCVIARFRKFRGTRDSRWLCGRGGSCGAVGVTSILLCSPSYVFCLIAIFVLYSFICASKRILFIDDEKIVQIMRATCLLTCVCIAHVYIPFKSEKRNHIKLNIAYRIVKEIEG